MPVEVDLCRYIRAVEPVQRGRRVGGGIGRVDLTRCIIRLERRQDHRLEQAQRLEELVIGAIAVEGNLGIRAGAVGRRLLAAVVEILEPLLDAVDVDIVVVRGGGIGSIADAARELDVGVAVDHFDAHIGVGAVDFYGVCIGLREVDLEAVRGDVGDEVEDAVVREVEVGREGVRLVLLGVGDVRQVGVGDVVDAVEIDLRDIAGIRLEDVALQVDIMNVDSRFNAVVAAVDLDGECVAPAFRRCCIVYCDVLRKAVYGGQVEAVDFDIVEIDAQHVVAGPVRQDDVEFERNVVGFRRQVEAVVSDTLGIHRQGDVIAVALGECDRELLIELAAAVIEPAGHRTVVVDNRVALAAEVAVQQVHRVPLWRPLCLDDVRRLEP